MEKIRVLVCDDSALMRRQLVQIIESDSALKVVGTARDGLDSLDKARSLSPDVITMDVNMPGIDGITALQIIQTEKIAPVIMVSSLTQKGAETTLEAMMLGAFDYVPKPSGTVSANMSIITRDLIRKIKSATAVGTIDRLSSNPEKAQSRINKSLYGEKQGIAKHKYRSSVASAMGYKAVAIGISTGGPKTLMAVLPYLPADLNAAIFVVQHMPANFTTSFAKRINDHCKLVCVESEAGMVVEPRKIYLAKGGYHLTLHKERANKVLIRAPRQPEHSFIPSVDVMMESVLNVYGNDTIGVLMTGMGDDGANSMVKIREAEGLTIAESEESAVVFGMPNEAIKRGGADVVLPNWDIADEIVRMVN